MDYTHVFYELFYSADTIAARKHVTVCGLGLGFFKHRTHKIWGRMRQKDRGHFYQSLFYHSACEDIVMFSLSAP